MRISFFCGFCLLFFASCNGQTKSSKQLKIENIRFEYGRETLNFYKIFDSENKPLIYKAGNKNTTDSIVYKYDINGDLEGFYEYEPNSEGVLTKKYHKQIDAAINNVYSFIILDTFNLLDEVTCKEIDLNYKNRLRMDSIKNDSGFVFKYSYPVGEIPFFVLPYSSNNRGADEAEKLDSLIVKINNKMLSQEEYFFERNKQVIRKYYYNGYRLIRVRTNLFLNNKIEEGFDELYTYKYIK